MCAETEPMKTKAGLDPSGEDKTSVPESDTLSLAFSPKSLLEEEEEEEDEQEDERDVALSIEPAQAENPAMASSGFNYSQRDEYAQEWEDLGAPTGGFPLCHGQLFPVCHGQLLEEQIAFMTVRTVEARVLSLFCFQLRIVATQPYSLFSIFSDVAIRWSFSPCSMKILIGRV
jgi:hypothetical protein